MLSSLEELLDSRYGLERVREARRTRLSPSLRAEESASASEELHAQTEELRAAMLTLRQIVHGARAAAKGHHATSPSGG